MRTETVEKNGSWDYFAHPKPMYIDDSELYMMTARRVWEPVLTNKPFVLETEAGGR